MRLVNVVLTILTSKIALGEGRPPSRESDIDQQLIRLAHEIRREIQPGPFGNYRGYAPPRLGKRENIDGKKGVTSQKRRTVEALDKIGQILLNHRKSLSSDSEVFKNGKKMMTDHLDTTSRKRTHHFIKAKNVPFWYFNKRGLSNQVDGKKTLGDGNKPAFTHHSQPTFDKFADDVIEKLTTLNKQIKHDAINERDEKMKKRERVGMKSKWNFWPPRLGRKRETTLNRNMEKAKHPYDRILDDKKGL
uniref:Uncharacterized protein n=1 Tax=Clytia hemisphaerica TaxID=252671 RepID=A0A7M5WLA9_9CNID|eukprot:TCONS_00015647-protein